MGWIKRWEVESENGNGKYVVAIDQNGVYGCSCPQWKFRRQECKHIARIKITGGKEIRKPEYVLAVVHKPRIKDDKLLVPLVRIGDVHMEATIIWAMLKAGYSWGEIKEKRHLPGSWTLQAVKNYIETHGEAEYPKDYYKRRR